MIKSADPSITRASWQRVFLTNDTFAWPFQPEILIGRVFYPTDGFHLTSRQYACVLEAVQETGESGFFLSVTESVDLRFLERPWGHWTCELPTYEEYSELSLTLENSIYSKGGTWGVLVSHELHAVIGGSKAFMDVLDAEYSEWESDAYQLRAAWSNNPNAKEVDDFLRKTRR